MPQAVSFAIINKKSPLAAYYHTGTYGHKSELVAA